MRISKPTLAKYALITILVAVFFIAYQNNIKAVFALKEKTVYESQLSVYRYNDSIIYYHTDVKPALALIESYLNQAKADNILLFGNVMNDSLTIKLHYNEEVFKSINTKLKNYVGLYVVPDKVIHLLVKDCFDDVLSVSRKSTNFKQYFLHEFTHYAFNEFLEYNDIKKSRIPMWFSEGVADYIGYEGPFGIEPDALAEFSKLIDTKGWQEYYSKDYSIYEQSHYAVSQMILQKGENVVQEILLKSKVLSFDEAFETVMGFDLDEYFNILQKDLQNKWRSYNTLALEKNDRTIDYNIRGKCLEEYLAENPDKISAMLDLCLIYEDAGKLEKANEKYKLAISKAPENMSVFRKFAAFSERLKDTRVWEKVRAAEELLIISEKRQGHMLPYLIYREFI